MNRDMVIAALLLVTWCLTSFGLAQQNVPLITAGIPSLTLALILHLTSLRTANVKAHEVIDHLKVTR